MYFINKLITFNRLHKAIVETINNLFIKFSLAERIYEYGEYKSAVLSRVFKEYLVVTVK